MPKNKNWNQSLISAVTNGDLNSVELCVLSKADVNHYSCFGGDTPLIKAAYFGLVEIVEYLLGAGADANKPDIVEKRTALSWAVEQEQRETVKILLSNGAAIDQADQSGDTPLIIAVRYCYFDILDDLITAGADINQLSHDGYTLLAMAVYRNDMRAVQALLKRNADFYKCGKGGMTPLLVAVLNKRWRILEYLLSKGLDLNGIDSEGNTVLINAAKTGNEECVKYLVQRGADVCKVGMNGKTPLSVAVETNNITLVEYLLSQRTESSIPSAFSAAIEVGSVDLLKLLKDAGYSEIMKCRIDHDRDNTFLIKAVEIGNVEIADFLLKLGAELNLPVETGCTPLTKAVEKNDFNMVQFLLQNGAYIDQMDSRKMNALMIAASNSSFLMSKYLVDCGANVQLAKAHLDFCVSVNIDYACSLQHSRTRRYQS